MSYRGENFDPDRIKYWLHPEIEYLIKKDKIEFIPHSTLESINEQSVILNTGQSIPADFVLLLTGYQQDQTLFEQLGIELITDDRKPKMCLKTMETNVPNVFVAGTATAGSQQRTKVFIETSHIHVDRIVAALQGKVHNAQAEDFWLEES
jgi:thioredoxin reductase (NADPH)